MKETTKLYDRSEKKHDEHMPNLKKIIDDLSRDKNGESSLLYKRKIEISAE